MRCLLSSRSECPNQCWTVDPISWADISPQLAELGAGQDPPLLIAHLLIRQRPATPSDRVAQAKLVQHTDPVGVEHPDGARCGPVRGSLDDFRGDALVLKRDRGGKAADTPSGDEHAQVRRRAMPCVHLSTSSTK